MNDRWNFGRPTRTARNSGQAMVEFAIVAIALYLLIAGILTFGRMFFAAQVLQQASDVFAKELSETPLPPDATLYGTASASETVTPAALQDPTVVANVFDQTKLSFNITPWMNNSQGLTLLQYLEQNGPLPIVNRLLVPLMIIEQQNGVTTLTYPGIQLDANGNYDIPLLSSTGTVQMIPVVEAAGSPDCFPLQATSNAAGTLSATGGIAAVRLNYAFQSEWLSAHDSSGNLIEAPSTESPNYFPTSGGLYQGEDQLGQQQVAAMIVRPYQVVLNGQAAYRREIFAPEAATTTTP